MRGNCEENVEGENMYENGCKVRATGGTCELSGKVMVGIAKVKGTKTAHAYKRMSKDIAFAY